MNALKRFIVTVPLGTSVPPVDGGYYFDVIAHNLAEAQQAADRVAPGVWGFCHHAGELTDKELAEMCPNGAWAMR